MSGPETTIREAMVPAATAIDRRAGARDTRRRRWQRFRHHRFALASGILLILLGLLSLGAPVVEWLLGVNANEVDLTRLKQGPSLAHPLGTDELGRDVLSRLLYGGRISLLVGLAAALVAAVIGTLIGILAGFYRGWLDAVLMRITDAVIALPVLALLIVLAAIDLEKVGLPAEIARSQDVSLYRIIAIIGLVGWTQVARLVRGSTLAVKEREYVLAARALGASNRRIILVHILPNVLSPIVVATTLSIGGIILFESILSFLGLGIQPPFASWGNMLTNAQELMYEAPMLMVYPGLLIFLTVMAFNFLGDGLQDALDPRALSDRG